MARAPRRIVWFDTETNDLKPGQIIDYAIQEWVDGELGRNISRRVMPTIPVEPGAAKCNGFTVEAWEASGATPLSRLDVEAWHEFLGNRAIVGGCNIGFDLRFVEAECARLGLACPDWSHRAIDVQQGAGPLWVAGEIESTSLESLCNYFGISNEGAHGAVRDVERTIAVFEAMTARYMGWDRQ